MDDVAAKATVRNVWDSAAPGWVKWEETFSGGLRPATDKMLDMAGVTPGARILDLACGAGIQTFLAAERVGPDGAVVAIDISGTMLDHVRKRAARERIANIETMESAAEDLDPDQAPFDAAICRLGLMLFPSPARAVAAVLQILKPGARFATLVFTAAANNPFMAKSMQILLRHAGKQPPAAGRPGLFALGGVGTLESVLKESGLTDVETTVMQASLKLPSIDETLEMMQQAFGAYRAVIADLSESRQSAAWEDVRAFLAEFESGGAFEASMEFLIGAGSKLLPSKQRVVV
jgi:ubiquinone/menaquinone biosynthesis C-methylase UbiE